MEQDNIKLVSNPRVVIVGAGFGGLSAAKAFRKAPVQLTLIDRNNYHLFQPLLYQVATAGLTPAEIAQPVRTILRKQKNFHFRMAEVKRVDFDHHQLETDMGSVSYDYLILSVGSEVNFFGKDDLFKDVFVLKGLDDAIDMRNHILSQFELAEQEDDPEKRAELLTFIVVGGGPTGVESSGALSELVRLVLVKDYPMLDFSQVRIMLVEMKPHLLDGFPQSLQDNAFQELKKKQVEVRLNSYVRSYDGQKAVFGDESFVRTRTLIWAAGVKVSDLVANMGLSPDKQKGALVAPTLQLPGHPDVYVIGDSAFFTENDVPLPLVATVAVQHGRLAARNILHAIKNEELEIFNYKDPGSLATIGRNKAVVRVGALHFTGFPAWLVWVAVHIYGLSGCRNRLLVLFNWIWDYFLYEREMRLITRRENH